MFVVCCLGELAVGRRGQGGFAVFKGLGDWVVVRCVTGMQREKTKEACGNVYKEVVAGRTGSRQRQQRAASDVNAL